MDSFHQCCKHLLLSTQRQSLASFLREVGDIFNGGPHGLGSLAGAPRATHPMEGVTHIDPGGLILHDAAGTHHCYSRLHHCCQLQHEQSPAMGPSANRTLLLRSPEVVSAVQFPAAQLVMWALLYGPVTVPLPCSFPQNSCYEVSVWTPRGLEGPTQWLTGLEGCNTSLHQGIEWANGGWPLPWGLRNWVPLEVSQWGLLPLQQPFQPG